jgi:hypothetical protein
MNRLRGAVVTASPTFPVPPRGGALSTLLGVGLLFVAGSSLAAPMMSIPLECRLGEGPWRDCSMQVEQIGAHWTLIVEGERYEFRHDGRGSVRMLSSGEGWRPVSSRWNEDTSLCWDGVCARGDIPLD